ncbi:MAG: SDR family NAD(P)-dependent oxidoreductase [Acidimicrobiales bacterium]
MSAVAWVAGGAGAIGGAIARGLAADGFAIGIIDRDADGAKRAVATLEADHGVADAAPCDLTSIEGIRSAAAELTARLGEPHVLVHAAGIYPRAAVAEMDADEWTAVLATNLTSAFVLSQAVLPSMLRRADGRIVYVTSSLGTSGSERGAHYAASKAGLDALMRSLSSEVAHHGIGVNCVAPGLTESPMMRRANSDAYVESVTAGLPGGRLGQPEDVVPLVRFLVGPGAHHVTGQVYALR